MSSCGGPCGANEWARGASERACWRFWKRERRGEEGGKESRRNYKIIKRKLRNARLR